MTALELKGEITRKLDVLPENSLTELLNLIREMEQYPSLDIASVYQIKQIVSENRELLQKLAE